MRHLVAIVLFCLCAHVVADDAGDRARLAQRLADLLEVRSQYGKASVACRQSDAEVDSALFNLYARRTAEFGGISPNSAYWPEARAIYRRFVDGTCEVTTGERVEFLVVKAYAATMSIAQLRAAVAFYASPAGRAMQAGNRSIFHGMTDLAERVSMEERDAAALIYQQSMRVLKNKYKADPR